MKGAWGWMKPFHRYSKLPPPNPTYMHPSTLHQCTPQPYTNAPYRVWDVCATGSEEVCATWSGCHSITTILCAIAFLCVAIYIYIYSFSSVLSLSSFLHCCSICVLEAIIQGQPSSGNQRYGCGLTNMLFTLSIRRTRMQMPWNLWMRHWVGPRRCGTWGGHAVCFNDSHSHSGFPLVGILVGKHNRWGLS